MTKQAEALNTILSTTYKDNAGAKAILEAMNAGVKDTGSENARAHKLDLASTNIPSLLEALMNGDINGDRGTYRSNGSRFIGDSYAISIIEPIYKTHKAALDPIFKSILTQYDARRTSVDMVKTATVVTDNNIGTILSDVDRLISTDNKNAYKKQLDGLSPEVLTDRVKKLIQMAGGNPTFTDKA